MSRRKSIITLLILIFIYIPPLIKHAVWGCIFLFLFICIINYNETRKLVTTKQIKLWIFGCAVLSLGMMNSIYIYGLSEGISLSSSFFCFLVYVPTGLIAILVILNKYQLNRRECWECIIVAGLIQTMLALAAYLIDPFQNFLLHFVENIMSAEDVNYWSAYRLYGLSASLSFGMPIVQVLIGSLCFLYAEKYNYKYYFFVPFIWISGIINARVGIVVLLVLITIWFFDRIIRFRGRVKSSLFCVMSIALGCVVMFVLLLLMEKVTVSTRITDPIEELISVLNGTFIPKSNGFFSYYYPGKGTLDIPSGIELLFGGGILNNKADTGYIIYLWHGGILFSVAVYIYYFWLIKKWYNSVKHIKDMRVIVWGMGIILYVVNLKGDAFTSISEFVCLFFLAVALGYHFREKRDGIK